MSIIIHNEIISHHTIIGLNMETSLPKLHREWVTLNNQITDLAGVVSNNEYEFLSAKRKLIETQIAHIRSILDNS